MISLTVYVLSLERKGKSIGCVFRMKRGNRTLYIWGLSVWVADVFGLSAEKPFGKSARYSGIDGEVDVQRWKNRHSRLKYKS